MPTSSFFTVLTANCKSLSSLLAFRNAHHFLSCRFASSPSLTLACSSASLLPWTSSARHAQYALYNENKWALSNSCSVKSDERRHHHRRRRATNPRPPALFPPPPPATQILVDNEGKWPRSYPAPPGYQPPAAAAGGGSDGQGDAGDNNDGAPRRRQHVIHKDVTIFK